MPKTKTTKTSKKAVVKAQPKTKSVALARPTVSTSKSDNSLYTTLEYVALIILLSGAAYIIAHSTLVSLN